jgi:hypothetical protein
MRNFVKHGRMITVVASGPIASGDGVIVGSIFGIAATNAVEGQDFEFCVEGRVRLEQGARRTHPGRACLLDGRLGHHARHCRGLGHHEDWDRRASRPDGRGHGQCEAYPDHRTVTHGRPPHEAGKPVKDNRHLDGPKRAEQRQRMQRIRERKRLELEQAKRRPQPQGPGSWRGAYEPWSDDDLKPKP